ncbi:MAG: bifunctional 5,10-methylenetetrahydrofolate dehydrogenase/5,10-methenyltetrahydrofolate cyclohydrolase [Spirochaetia bacterium]|nr:bifunctional 5,10-methylenetetrahydrofolate dehydrogenase/5,10-methenyltetrahydrofolate cyclohydrolase [Spirochaetia bacterium]
MATLIDGKLVSEKILGLVQGRVSKLASPIKLTVILVGEDPASQTYVASKEKACHKTGISSEIVRLPAATTETELLTVVHRLNQDPGVHGILCQRPLPKHIHEQKILLSILPEKDVDCFHPWNTGLLFEGHPRVLPCTPGGIISLLEHYQIPVAGKHCVLIGRSNIVGKPMAHLFLQANGTVTICHSKTEDLPSLTRQADILCAAIGRPNFVTADMVKEGAVVIDVGINRIEDKSKPKGYRNVGDVDFEAVAPKCSAITPVPGGVGPMTIATLLQNVLSLASK